MSKRQLTIIIGSLIILAQVVIFKNYIPFLTNKIIITNQWCTCPDARVLSGENYLKTITPDSLKKYDIDYSEMYVKNEISTSSDPMGVEQYIITGEIIGKSSISEGDGHYYPLFRIDSYDLVFFHNLLKWFIRGLLLIEVYFLYKFIRSRKYNGD
jgi:hypothetical protein